MSKPPKPSTPTESSTPSTPGLTSGPSVTTAASAGDARGATSQDLATGYAKSASVRLSDALLSEGAKQTAAPLASLAPQPAEQQPTAVVVKIVDNRVGIRVFALRGFAKGEAIYRERISLEATHHSHPNGTRDAYEKYRGLASARRDAMHGAFPGLAAANNVDPDSAATCRSLIGSRLLGGASIDVRISADEYTRLWRIAAARSSPSSSSSRLSFSAFSSRLGGSSRNDGRSRNTKRETLEWFSRLRLPASPDEHLHGASQPGRRLPANQPDQPPVSGLFQLQSSYHRRRDQAHRRLQHRRRRGADDRLWEQ